MKPLVPFVFFLSFYTQSQVQKEFLYSALHQLNGYQFEKLDTLINQIESEKLKQLYLNEKHFLTDGIVSDTMISIETGDFDQDFERAIAYYFLAKQQIRNQLNSENVYQNLIKSYEIAENEKQLKKEILFELIYHLERFSRKDPHLIKLIEKYIKEYRSLAITYHDFYWVNSFLFGLEMQMMEYAVLFEPNERMDYLLNQMKKYSRGSPFLTSQFNMAMGIYLEVFEKDYSVSLVHLQKAKEFYQSIPYHYAKTKRAMLNNSIGIVLYRQKKYNEAISVFETLLKEKKKNGNPILIMQVNDWLYQCFLAKKEHQKALFYFTEYKKIFDALDQRKYAQLIQALEASKKLEKNQNALDKLHKKTIKLKSQLMIFIPLFSVFTLLSIGLFLRYKKSRKKGRQLEVEKTTLEKMILRNHITLKNGKIVYFTRLLYVKASDKYYWVFESDQKRHLIRGKISDIEMALPPNFIRLHRSYIVNRNFVKQVLRKSVLLFDDTELPISRRFKGIFG